MFRFQTENFDSKQSRHWADLEAKLNESDVQVEDKLSGKNSFTIFKEIYQQFCVVCLVKRTYDVYWNTFTSY